MCFAVESQRERALAVARAAAAVGQIQTAIDLAISAAELRRGTDADRILAATHLLAGDFPAAWAHYGKTSS
jgi:hypothetical protein